MYRIRTFVRGTGFFISKTIVVLDSILTLTKQFVSIKSTPDNKEALDEILELALAELGGFSIERFERNNIKSALIYNTKTRPKKFKILLNGHLDIIPGKEEQYIPKVVGNRLYGVGSMDMKANVVCLIAVFKEVASVVSYPLALQLVTDEEIGGFDGTKYQVEKGVRADFVIAGEPTNFDIVHKAKGVLWMKIRAKGKTAHGAYPWRGENAIEKMKTFLDLLQKNFPNPSKEQWVTTVNVANIETDNQAFNKIPDNCTVWLDVRHIPEERGDIIKKIKKIVPKGFAVEIVANEAALLTDQKNVYLKALEAITKKVTKKNVAIRGAQGSSDARHFASVNCPGVEFGPIGKGIGSDMEWVDIPSLGSYYEIVKKFLLSL